MTQGTPDTRTATARTLCTARRGQPLGTAALSAHGARAARQRGGTTASRSATASALTCATSAGDVARPATAQAIANALSHDVYYNMIQPVRAAGQWLIGIIIAAVVVALIYLLAAVPGPLGLEWRWWSLLALAGLVIVVAPLMRTATAVGRRLIMARALLLLVAVASAALASTRPSASLIDRVVGFEQAKEVYEEFDKGRCGKILFDPWR